MLCYTWKTLLLDVSLFPLFKIRTPLLCEMPDCIPKMADLIRVLQNNFLFFHVNCPVMPLCFERGGVMMNINWLYNARLSEISRMCWYCKHTPQCEGLQIRERTSGCVSVSLNPVLSMNSVIWSSTTQLDQIEQFPFWALRHGLVLINHLVGVSKDSSVDLCPSAMCLLNTLTVYTHPRDLRSLSFIIWSQTSCRFLYPSEIAVAEF